MVWSASLRACLHLLVPIFLRSTWELRSIDLAKNTHSSVLENALSVRLLFCSTVVKDELHSD
jgi:hypothetical protein